MSELNIATSTEPGFANAGTFELLQRAAKLLSSSTLVPPQYRSRIEKKEYGKVVGYEDNPNAVANCVIALNIARRMRADELMVMQNLYIVEGRPSWSSQWVIAAVNTCGKFSPLRFEIKDLGMQEVEYTTVSWENNKKINTPVKTKVQNLQCIAWATEKETGERVESPPVDMRMAVLEGWYQKNGSKWQTMPQVMLRYRAASFFGRLYAPELLMGLPTSEEVHDEPEERKVSGREVPDTGETAPQNGHKGLQAMLTGASKPAVNESLSAEEEVQNRMQEGGWGEGDILDAVFQIGIKKKGDDDTLRVLDWANINARWVEVEAAMRAPWTEGGAAS